MSFSAPLRGARVTSLWMAKEKSPRERPPRCRAFRPFMAEKSVRSGRACRRAIHGAAASGRHPLRPPCGPDRPARTAAQGPRTSPAWMTAILACSGRAGDNPPSVAWTGGMRCATPALRRCSLRADRSKPVVATRTHGLSPLSAVTERGSLACERNRFLRGERNLDEDTSFLRVWRKRISIGTKKRPACAGRFVSVTRERVAISP